MPNIQSKTRFCARIVESSSSGRLFSRRHGRSRCRRAPCPDRPGTARSSSRRGPQAVVASSGFPSLISAPAQLVCRVFCVAAAVTSAAHESPGCFCLDFITGTQRFPLLRCPPHIPGPQPKKQPFQRTTAFAARVFVSACTEAQVYRNAYFSIASITAAAFSIGVLGYSP